MPHITHPLQHYSGNVHVGRYSKTMMTNLGQAAKLYFTNLQFSDHTEALAKKQELEALAESLDKICTGYKMEKVLRR